MTNNEIALVAVIVFNIIVSYFRVRHWKRQYHDLLDSRLRQIILGSDAYHVTITRKDIS